MNQVSNKIMGLLGDVDINQVNILIDLANAQLLNKLKKYKGTLSQVPEDLEYILIDLVVARFNNLGSEGMLSENVEGRSMTFVDKFMDRYDSDIEIWAQSSGLSDDNKGRVLFL